MMRSRSRSRPRNTNRSRSRSPPYYNREKSTNHRYEGNKPFRGNPFYRGQGGRHLNNRHRGDFRQRDFSPRRSPPQFNRRSRSPMRSNYHLNVKKEEFNNHHPSRQSRSPPPYDSNMYRRSLTPQRLPLTMEPIPKEQTIFVGPGGTLIDLNELKKITVDIRRNLPRGGVSAAHGPIRYVVNPSEVVLARRPGEGSRPIFDREELKPRPIEERVIKLAPDAVAERLDHQRQPSPPSRIRGGGDVSSFSGPPQLSFQSQSQEGRSVDGDSEGDLRFRLMEKKSSEEMKERMNADPNYVPQGRYYYEHDNREKFNNRGRGGGFVHRGRGNYQHNNQHPYHQQSSGGGYRGNYRGGGGGNSSGGGGYQQREQFRGGSSYRGKRSPDWTHDLYDAAAPVDDGKPSSTTPM